MLIEEIDKDYVVQVCHPKELKNDYKKISALYENCFGQKVNDSPFIKEIVSGNMRPYEWKYLESPNSDKNYVGIIKQGDQLVAHASFLVHNAIFKDKEVKAVQGLDAMVHSLHREQSLYKKLREYLCNLAKADDVNFYYGFPNATNPIAKPKNKAEYGIQAISDVPFFENTNIQNNTVKLKQINTAPAEVIEIWKAMTKKAELSIVRDQNFINWRYVNNEINKNNYTLLSLDRPGSGIQGLVVLKTYSPVSSNNPKKGHIVDIISPDAETTQFLVDGAENFLFQLNIHTNSMFLYPTLHGAEKLQERYNKPINAFTLVVSGFKEPVTPNFNYLMQPGDNDVF